MTRTWRKATAWTGLYLLAINLIAGALMPAQAQVPLSQLASQTYICTAFGLTAIGPYSGQKTDGSAGHQAQLCVFCLPLMQGGLDSPAPAMVSAADVAAGSADYTAPPPAFISPQARHNAAAPRAPPVV